MVEWHLPPDYIVNNWTEELLNLMVEKLAERRKDARAMTGKDVPIEALSVASKGAIKVVKK